MMSVRCVGFGVFTAALAFALGRESTAARTLPRTRTITSDAGERCPAERDPSAAPSALTRGPERWISQPAAAGSPAALPALGLPDPERRLDRLLWRALHVPSDPLSQLRDEAAADPALLSALIERYEQPDNDEEAQTLAELLATMDAPAINDLGLTLARSSQAAERAQGFALLKGCAASSPEARANLYGALRSERDPAVLGAALRALDPAHASISEAERVTAELRRLSAHEDLDVRAQSLIELARWDADAHAEEDIYRALGDPQPALRRAGVSAAAAAHLDSERVRAALWSILGAADQSAALKHSALAVLEQGATDEPGP
jgi:hypothetical protein